MKKLICLSLLSLASLFYTNVNAQININISSQPLWGPVGYDRVENYYLPDIETYYNVPNRQFVYLNNGNWVTTNTLPARYSNYNLYNGYKAVVNGNKPYQNFNSHKSQFGKYKNWGGKQMAIRNSRDSRYYVIKGHPHGMPPGQAKKIMGKPEKGNNGKGNNGKGKGQN